MTGPARTFLALLAILAGCCADAASANPPPPRPRLTDLRVLDGEGWHAENVFPLRWRLEWPEGAPPILAIHYQVLDATGRVVDEYELSPWHELDSVRVPADGAYVIEVWAEDRSDGGAGRARAHLLLDTTRPGPTRPLVPDGWIGAGAAHLRLAHPEGPAPISGLRGYAVSVDTDPAGSPCKSPERCREEEIDLRGGPGDDQLIATGLPEGKVYVHAVAVSGSGRRSDRVGTAVAHVDVTAPRVSLQGAPTGWANGVVRIAAAATDALSGMAAAGPDGPLTAIAVDGGLPATSQGGSALTLVNGDGVHRVEASARDAAGNFGPAGDAVAATVRIDATPPRVAFASRRDPDADRLEATVADSLSGASARRGEIAVRPARSRQRFAPLPTIVSGGRLLALWDLDAHPAGTYEFQATGYDVAGNSASSVVRGDGTRMLIVNPQKARTSLRAGFGRERAQAQTTTLGRAAEVRGRLTTANGSPLGGEEIAVTEAFDPGAVVPRRTTRVRTAADGSFAVGLASGPSRRVELAFGGGRALAPSAAPPLRIEARGGVRMRASAPRARVGGRPIVFSGRVRSPGTGPPPDGLPIALQFRLPGFPWSEFRTVVADRQGRFRYRYAFTDDDSRGVRFQFRAMVAERDGWPFATGASRPIAVTGR